MGRFKIKRRLEHYRMPEERNPVCPHCEREIDGLMSRRMTRITAWTCPRCLKILGVSDRAIHM